MSEVTIKIVKKKGFTWSLRALGILILRNQSQEKPAKRNPTTVRENHIIICHLTRANKLYK